MDDAAFVRDLQTALPEAFLELDENDFVDGEGPSANWALGYAETWFRMTALKMPKRGSNRVARVRKGHEETVGRFFAFLEAQATVAGGDAEAQNLVAMGCTHLLDSPDGSAYLGPRTRQLGERFWAVPEFESMTLDDMVEICLVDLDAAGGSANADALAPDVPDAATDGLAACVARGFVTIDGPVVSISEAGRRWLHRDRSVTADAPRRPRRHTKTFLRAVVRARRRGRS